MGQPYPGTVPLDRPPGLGGIQPGPRTAARHGPGRPPGRPRRRPAVPRVHGRGRGRAAPVPRDRGVVPGTLGLAVAIGRLLLAGVRHHRGPAPVLRRARGAGRGSPQGGGRPGSPDRRRRPPLRTRLFPSGARRRGVAAGALPDVGPSQHAPRAGRGGRDRGPAGRAAAPGPGLAGPGRPDLVVPPRRRRRRQRRRRPPGHRSPVRWRQRTPPAPGDPARHGRSPRPPGPGGDAPAVPHERGSRRVLHAREDPHTDA